MKFLTLFSLTAALGLTSALPHDLDSTLSPRTDLQRRANDYPYKASCPGSGVDPWNFYKCQCTSFVAWRINDRLGKKFTNQYKGEHFGNANTWDTAARAAGVTINQTPKVNSVAQSNGGTYGHVAWVTAVDGSQVTIEEYNWANAENYGKRTVAKGTFSYYIHF